MPMRSATSVMLSISTRLSLRATAHGTTGSPPAAALAKAASSTAAVCRDSASGSTHPGPPRTTDDISSTMTR